jgi:hypothetical protein
MSAQKSSHNVKIQDFKDLEDKVRFGEVAQAPPNLKFSNKMIKRKMDKVSSLQQFGFDMHFAILNRPRITDILC